MTSHLDQTRTLMCSSGPVIMGILNVTPDSFSDGGRFDRIDTAIQHASAMIEEGVDIIDIGGESTRPGAQPVTAAEECDRVLPVIEAIRRQYDVPVSIDTSKTEVIRQAIDAGASMVNDVNALRADGAVEACAELGVPVCLMHMQGQPRTMQDDPRYDDVIDDVKSFLQDRADVCERAGISREDILLDPGFGFGKTLEHNLTLLTGLGRLCELEYPVLAGVSRKSMFASILTRNDAADPQSRVEASVVAAVIARQKGARWFRVHDVQQTRDAFDVMAALEKNVNG